MAPSRDPKTGRFISGSGVDIALTATDVNVTSQLTGIRALIHDLAAPLTSATGKTDGLFKAMMQSNLATMALSKVQEGVGSLFNGVQQAMQFQTMSMSLAGDVGTNIGIGFKEANSAVLDIQRQIAKEAAALPGVTKQYNDVFNGLGSSIAKVFPHDLPRFKEAVLDVTKRVGMLSAVKNIDANKAGQSINRAVSGTTGFGDLSQLDIFEKNPQLMNAMRTELQKMGKGVNSWKTLSDTTRLNIIRKGLKIATPDSLISEFDSTVESLWQGVQTKLFDPLVGIGGFMREIPSLNNTTVMDAIKDLLSGFTKVWASAEKVAAKMGLNFDPLVPLVRVITLLSDFEYNILGVLDKFGKPLNLDKLFDPTELARRFGNWINSGLQGVGRLFLSVKTIDFAALVGNITTIVPKFLSTLLDTISWEKLGFTIGNFLAKLLISNIMNLPRNLVALGGLFISLVSGVFRLLFGLITGVIYGGVVAPAMESFKAATDPIVEFFNWVSEGIKGLWDKVKGLIAGAGRLLNLPGQAVQTVTSAVQSAVSDPLGTAMKMGQSVLDAVTGKNSKDVKPGVGAADPTKGSTTRQGNKLPAINVTPAAAAAPIGVSSFPMGSPESRNTQNAPLGKNSDNKMSVLPLATPAPLPMASNTQTVASATFAPVINMPVTTNALDQKDMLSQLGRLMEQQYQQFKNGRLAHGIA